MGCQSINPPLFLDLFERLVILQLKPSPQKHDYDLLLLDHLRVSSCLYHISKADEPYVLTKFHRKSSPGFHSLKLNLLPPERALIDSTSRIGEKVHRQASGSTNVDFQA
jgi:hypothetical protein